MNIGTIDFVLKILLVDVEPFIRKDLNALIEWEAEGYCIAGTAAGNGYNISNNKYKNRRIKGVILG